MDHKERRIYEGKNWEIYLHENQCYLGRTYLWAKRDDDVDFLEMTFEERDEFFLLGRAMKSALGVVFQPDRINYAALSNASPHLHVHIIPRYDSTRTFSGQSFHDHNPAGNYVPYNRGFIVEEQVMSDIRSTLTRALTKALQDGAQ